MSTADGKRSLGGFTPITGPLWRPIFDVEVEVCQRFGGQLFGQSRRHIVTFARLDDLVADKARLIIGEPELPRAQALNHELEHPVVQRQAARLGDLLEDPAVFVAGRHA
jgi:hypothetical protein